MLPTSKTFLPDELVHAILIRLQDGELWGKQSKRGLALCSLTCRHWAKLIKPMLFGYLTLMCTEDVSQLLAFLCTPDFLHCALRDCAHNLDLVEDRASSSIPWGHHVLLRLHQHLPHVFVNWAVKGASADGRSKLSSLPSGQLPRTLPSSSVTLHHVTLSCL
ncbi:uncharacterized protein PHACADRAFT_261515 [Phanerochaete carnosa HHB-10118-sp]|uniref:F-box domain-containing protein n=1 Tax=Phanerochaete carnosa (strain HHB-10118-sp) TaxID=650164 RepID=K5W1V8_PHACS|nr:uncharacterized protein PHACADRAFT_261515 [Phanerochaete carnosa HHB-10118-sp]EKM52859.1 hypothetical protein PHACADRAFT_261515 [Phanerochaete carnosa HHB-10118-sp]